MESSKGRGGCSHIRLEGMESEMDLPYDKVLGVGDGRDWRAHTNRVLRSTLFVIELE